MPPPDRRADPGRSCDCDALVARLDGDVALAREMARAFVAEAPALLAAIIDSARAGHAEDLRRAGHALKGAAANFDAAETVSIASDIEQAARRNDLDAVPALVTRLHAAAPLLVAALRDFGGPGPCES
jgi:HPt (histidine-containing phosphotransfer) domain-containing protein